MGEKPLSEQVIAKQTNALVLKGAREGMLNDFTGEALTFRALATNLIQSDSKYYGIVSMKGFPKLKRTDAQGNHTSYGTLSSFSMSIEISKDSAVLPIQDIDRRNYEAVGTMQIIRRGMYAVVAESVADFQSDLLNNLHTGKFRTFNGEIPAQATRPNTSLYMIPDEDGNLVNVAENVGAFPMSPEGITATAAKIKTHKTPFGTRLPLKIMCIVVHTSKEDEVRKIVRDFNITNDFGEPMPVGTADFKHKDTWLMLSTAHQIGWAFYPGFMFPVIRTHVDQLKNELDIIGEWFVTGYVAAATGFFLNIFQ